MPSNDEIVDGPSPLDELTTTELLAFFYKKGELRQELAEGLKNVGTGPLLGVGIDREFLQDEAKELRRMRLPKAAAIAEEFAPQYPSTFDPRFWNQQTTSWKYFLHVQRRRLEQRRKRLRTAWSS